MGDEAVRADLVRACLASPFASTARTLALGDLMTVMEELLAQLGADGRRWVVLIEMPPLWERYVQVLIVPESGYWPECVSNQFLRRAPWSTAQNERLPVIGWGWPSPPASPNWHFHDELLNTAHVVATLFERTLRDVAALGDDDLVRVVVQRVTGERL